MGNEINRDSAVYFDSAARVVPARLGARGISRVAKPEEFRARRRSAGCVCPLSRRHFIGTFLLAVLTIFAIFFYFTIFWNTWVYI